MNFYDHQYKLNNNIKKQIFKNIKIDDFCLLKDNDINNKLISYDEYLKLRNIKIERNKNNKIEIIVNNKINNLHDIIISEYASFFKYIVEKFMDDFPLNILIDNDWSKKKINIVFKSKKIYYIFNFKNKNIKINSIKSAINKYNYPAVLKLLNLGVKPTKIDLKVANYIKIKQIQDAIEYYY